MTDLRLDGVRMITTSSGGAGVVSAETELVSEQDGRIVSGRYHRGSAVDGYLIGDLQWRAIHFRYVQADRNGRIDAGVSEGMFDVLQDGRLRLTEKFQWITRPVTGANVFEEPMNRRIAS